MAISVLLNDLLYNKIGTYHDTSEALQNKYSTHIKALVHAALQNKVQHTSGALRNKVQHTYHSTSVALQKVVQSTYVSLLLHTYNVTYVHL